MSDRHHDWDYVVIGSGFGGAVSALRLAEKGYRVLVLEKGKRFGPDDFPRSNWQLKRWLWLPAAKMYGLFQMTFFPGIVIYSGVGVGGGSLVYANTLPTPKRPFFDAPSWSHLSEDWERELAPFYRLASNMLGATDNPRFFPGDEALRDVARDLGKEDRFGPTRVSVFFGKPKQRVPDPYFGGLGPDRQGCHFCGGCMLGCPHDAKNSLDKNYLYLAERLGVEVRAEHEVCDVAPIDAADGSGGYTVSWRSSTGRRAGRGETTTGGVVFSGGVLGTMKLMLEMQRRGRLPNLSPRLGTDVRTNHETLLSVSTVDSSKNLSDGIAIGSILHVDDDTHYEVVRYPSGSGFFRMLSGPVVEGQTAGRRFADLVKRLARKPLRTLRALGVRDWARHNQILLFMQTLDTRLRLRLGRFGLTTDVGEGSLPSPFVPLSLELAERMAEKLDGEPVQLLQESVFGIPSTAHILGGACMGAGPDEGVIDRDNRVFGYRNMYVCDGSMISANVGVNPSLTITALAERAMSRVPARTGVGRPARAPIGYADAGVQS